MRAADPLAGTWTLSPGDEWIVYPKQGGVWDSIRYEAMLEGIQDYELLRQLAMRNPAAADAICSRLVPVNPFVKAEQFDLRIESLRAARQAMLTALSRP